MIGLWLPDEQHGQFSRAAKATGKSLSDWIRDLAAAAIAPPKPMITAYSEPMPISQPGRKLTAQEIAARIGVGLSVGMPQAIPVDDGPWWDTGEDVAEPEAETAEARCRRMYPTQVAQASARSKQFKGKDAWGRMNWPERYEYIRAAIESGDTGAA